MRIRSWILAKIGKRGGDAGSASPPLICANSVFQELAQIRCVFLKIASGDGHFFLLQPHIEIGGSRFPGCGPSPGNARFGVHANAAVPRVLEPTHRDAAIPRVPGWFSACGASAEKPMRFHTWGGTSETHARSRRLHGRKLASGSRLRGRVPQAHSASKTHPS